MSKPQSSWTDDEVAALRRLAASHATAGQMARALGTSRSRNSIIGKCLRLGIALSSGNTGATGRKSKKTREPAPAKPRAVKVERPAPPAKTPTAPGQYAPGHKPPQPIPVDSRDGVSLLALEAGMCRATVGRATGSDQKFCGGQTPRTPPGSRFGIAGYETYCDSCRRRLSKPVPSRAR